MIPYYFLPAPAGTGMGVISMYRNRSQFIFAIICSLSMVAAVQSARAATPVPAASGAPLSSSFPGPLWEVIAPQGGRASVSMPSY